MDVILRHLEINRDKGAIEATVYYSVAQLTNRFNALLLNVALCPPLRSCVGYTCAWEQVHTTPQLRPGVRFWARQRTQWDGVLYVVLWASIHSRCLVKVGLVVSLWVTQ